MSLENRGLSVSTRTIERSIETLRDDFGVDISYNKTYNGYCIDKTSSIDFSDFLGFLKHSYSSKNIVDNLRDGKDVLKYIHFDSYTEMIGVEHIQPLLEAIRNRNVVHMMYKNLEEQTVYNTYLNPEFLKEYKNRWYVIGFDTNNAKQRIYALDRISRVFVGSRVFKRKLPDASDVFDNVIGLNITDKDPIEIQLSISQSVASDLKNIPFHHSQKILSDNDEELLISIFVRPNFDLKRKIQSYGHRIKVKKPFFLMDRI
ncbi:helix-turn-helix transcriptional regulator [Ancylomarina sp. YFZ004]